MKQRKSMILVAVVLLAAAAALFCVYRAFAPKAQAGRKTVELSIVHADGSRVDHRIVTDEDYLLGALSSVAALEGDAGGQFGYTLYSVDGERAEFNKDGAYWAIFVGDDYGTQSLDKQPLEDGGRYSVVYTTY